MKSILRSFLFVALASVAFTSCNSDDSISSDNSNISVRLIDAPGDYDNVFIDVIGVEAILDDEKVMLQTNSGIYDLLTLTGGEFVDLVDEDIPSGNLSQLRLILGSENTIVLDNGEEVALQTPSAQQSGLKLNINHDLQPGISYEFIMDFNVDKSIVTTGASGYILKPVIQISTSAESGAISGMVTPSEVSALVTATNNADDTIKVSTFTNPDSGAFLLFGVPEGTYTVVVEPEEESGFSSVTIENVEVEIENTTSLETVVLNN